MATRNLSLGLTVITEDPVLVVNQQVPNHEKLMGDFLNHSSEIQMKILNLYDFVEEVEDLKTTNKLLVKLKRIVDINSIETFEAGEEATKNIYLTASLLNHDCRPNLAWHPVKGRIVLNVLRSVVKGEELTVSYFAQAIGSYQRGEGCPTFNQRKEKLRRYRFECKCSVCREEEGVVDIKRNEFQALDLAQEGTESRGLGELLDIAETKLDLAKELDDQMIFLALIDCWKLSQFLALSCGDLEISEQSDQFKTEAVKYAKILGPCAVEAFNKFDNMYLEKG